MGSYRKNPNFYLGKFQNVVGINSIRVGDASAQYTVADSSGNLYQGGTALSTSMTITSLASAAGTAVSISATDAGVSGAGPALTLAAGAAHTSGVGGKVDIDAGAGKGASAGGAVELTGGTGGSTGTGGAITITSGASAGAGGTAGAIAIDTGAASGGTAAGITIGGSNANLLTIGCMIQPDAADGAASANGLLMGVGTSGDPATTSSADKSFVEFRTQSTATSGDSRGLYWRHDLNGDGQSGEAIRAFSKITGLPATARGAHISLDLDTANTKGISGLGAGVDAQILVGNGAAPAGGTYAVLNAEVYSGGSSSDMGAATELSFIRLVNGGDSTGAETVDDDAFFLSLSGFSAGAGHMLDSTIDANNAQIDHTLKIKWEDGSTKYIGVMDNADGS